MLNIIDSTEVIDGICEYLRNVEFEELETEEDLAAQIGDMLTEYLQPRLGELAVIAVAGGDGGRIKPVWAYGADFTPSVAVEVRGMPAIAFDVRMANEHDELSDLIGLAVGRALVYSAQYSYAVALVLDMAKSDLRKHWSDGEIDTRLWDNHRINLMVRS